MGYPGVGRDFDQKYEIFFKRLGKNVCRKIREIRIRNYFATASFMIRQRFGQG